RGGNIRLLELCRRIGPGIVSENTVHVPLLVVHRIIVGPEQEVDRGPGRNSGRNIDPSADADRIQAALRGNRSRLLEPAAKWRGKRIGPAVRNAVGQAERIGEVCIRQEFVQAGAITCEGSDAVLSEKPLGIEVRGVRVHRLKAVGGGIIADSIERDRHREMSLRRGERRGNTERRKRGGVEGSRRTRAKKLRRRTVISVKERKCDFAFGNRRKSGRVILEGVEPVGSGYKVPTNREAPGLNGKRWRCEQQAFGDLRACIRRGQDRWRQHRGGRDNENHFGARHSIRWNGTLVAVPFPIMCEKIYRPSRPPPARPEDSTRPPPELPPEEPPLEELPLDEPPPERPGE